MGNWKMNGSAASAESLCHTLIEELNVADAGIAVCVPYVYLPKLQTLTANSPLAIGAQNIADQESGAYTGEISGSMLKEFGCQYALVGHSERRTYYGDTDESVAARFFEAQARGIIPVLCIGETLAEREQNQTFNVINRQLDAIINKAGIEALANAVIAYEPVWAIGTGVTATDAQAQEVHKAIRERISAKNQTIADAIQILYGGSMKPNNAKGLLAMADIDGGLIGGASLEAKSFLAIYHSV
jgi:triosephosphate isomerase